MQSICLAVNEAVTSAAKGSRWKPGHDPLSTEEMEMPLQEEWETPCLKRADRQHCDCWYDGAACCACGDDAEGPAFHEGEVQ